MPALRILIVTATAAIRTGFTELSAILTSDFTAAIGADGARTHIDATTVVTAMAIGADIRIGAPTGTAAAMSIAAVTVIGAVMDIGEDSGEQEVLPDVWAGSAEVISPRAGAPEVLVADMVGDIADAM